MLTCFSEGSHGANQDAVLLVASDGLFATCTPAAIVGALGGEAPVEAALANAARFASGALSDDLSVALATRPAG